MNEPKRMTHDPRDPGGALLRSMRADRPRARSKAAVLGALGIAVGGATTAATTGASAAGAAASATAAKATVAAGAVGTAAPSVGALAIVTKWFAVGVVTGVVAVGGTKIAQHASNSPAPIGTNSAAAVAAQSATPPRRSAAFVATAPEPSASAWAEPSALRPRPPDVIDSQNAAEQESGQLPSQVPTPIASVNRGIEAPASSAPAAASAAPDTLAQELAALDEVRSVLAAGSGARALRLLDGYAATYPKQRLGTEASALRIEALLRSGRRAEAQALGQWFLATYPRSPLASHVQNLLQTGGSTVP